VMLDVARYRRVPGRDRAGAYEPPPRTARRWRGKNSRRSRTTSELRTYGNMLASSAIKPADAGHDVDTVAESPHLTQVRGP